MLYQKRAFSLIELLVVISLIVLLIAIIQPSLRNARISAQTAECSTQLHNIGVASHAYADDNREFVVRDYWFSNNDANNLANYGHYSLVGRYSPYINGPNISADDDDDAAIILDAARKNPIWRCPGEANPDYALTYVTNGVDFAYYGNTGSYTSGAASRWTSHPGVPSEVGHVFEANTINFHSPTGIGVYDVFTADRFTFWGGTPTPAPRMMKHDDKKHGGRTAILFFDTHVDANPMTPEMMPMSILNPLDTVN